MNRNIGLICLNKGAEKCINWFGVIKGIMKSNLISITLEHYNLQMREIQYHSGYDTVPSRSPPNSPALFISTSSLASLLLNSCANRLTDSRLAKFSCMNWISSWPVIWRSSFSVCVPFSESRHAKMTRAPLEARSWAVALPIPVLDPERKENEWVNGKEEKNLLQKDSIQHGLMETGLHGSWTFVFLCAYLGSFFCYHQIMYNRNRNIKVKFLQMPRTHGC